MRRISSLTLFCRVVDNYGDIGICWRLARQLALEHNLVVMLWVDDLASFQRLCPSVVIDADTQQIDTVTVRYWQNQRGTFSPADVSDLVIEFFGCDIPPSYIDAMVARTPQPVWLNLEGLSAEEWVEGCHALPSPHPSLPITKYFFYPGFTRKTGGLLMEADLMQQRQAFQQNPAEINAFLGTLGLTPAEIASTKISLFCYPHAPVSTLFDAWKKSENITCLIPKGVATQATEQFLGQGHLGGLTIRVIPFLSQPDYDKLLWACDLNFVRGEDSFVRAQWAGRPFVWHIYPQDNNLHHVKLQAFLNRLTAKTDDLVDLHYAWNAVTNPSALEALWPNVHADLPHITHLCTDWQHQLTVNGNLAANIIQFAQNIPPKRD